MNNSDPLVKDRGLVPSREHETSLALHRKNSIQHKHLDKELKRIEKEQNDCIRRTHLEKCALSRDQKGLASDLSKFTLSDDGVGDKKGSEEASNSQSGTRPKKVLTRRVSLPEKLCNTGVSMETKKDKQEKFLDLEMSRKIGKLKKASTRTDVWSKPSDERKGKPNINPNAWHHEDARGRERSSSSVFDRLTVGSNVNSMSSNQFLQRVRRQRSHTLPGSSTRTITEQK